MNFSLKSNFLSYSSYINPESVNGQFKLIDTDNKPMLSNERATFASCNSRAANHNIPTNNLPSLQVLGNTRTRLRMGRHDYQATISMRIQVNEPILLDGDNFVYFQYISRYLNPCDETDLVTRVVSQRVPLLRHDDDENFFNSFDEKALSVLLAKEAAYRCMVNDNTPEESNNRIAVNHDDIEALVLQSQKDLDVTVNRMSRAYFDFKNSR